MEFSIDQFSALLLIYRVEEYRNSYSLIRALEFKFGIIETTQLLADLKKMGFVSVESDGILNTYNLTNAGKQYIEQFAEFGINQLLNLFPNENRFINALARKEI